MEERENLMDILERIIVRYFPELSENEKGLPQKLKDWHLEDGEGESLRGHINLDLYFLCHGSEEKYIAFGEYRNYMRDINNAARKLDALLKNMPKQHRDILEEQMLLACPRWKRENDRDQGVYYDAKKDVVIISDDYIGLTGWHKKLDEYKNQTPAPTKLILSASSVVSEISDHILKHEITPDGVKAKNGANKKRNYIYSFYLFWRLIKGEEPNTSEKDLCFIPFVSDVFRAMNYVDVTSLKEVETLKTTVKNITKEEQAERSNYDLYDELSRINNPAFFVQKKSGKVSIKK